jgi:hypothetical protein
MTPNARAIPWRPLAAAGLLALFLAVQYSLFHRHARREITWAYPDHFDQAGYLGLTYTAYENIRAEGLLPVLVRELTATRATGVLFPVEGSLFLLLLGPSRLSALTMHFAHFALLQVTLFATLARLSRRWSVAWLGLGLLLAAATPFAPGGGMFDYRIDFSALCLFGVTLCLVARSGLFASWRWSALAGAAGSWLVLTRSLTVVYLVGVGGVVFVHLCLAWWRGDADRRRLARRQFGGLLLAGCVLAALVGPFFWNNRETFYTYYGVGHLQGVQAEFRNLGVGIRTRLDSLAYYPTVIAGQHLGPTFLALASLLAAAAVVLRLLARRFPGEAAPAGALDRGGPWLLAVAGLVVPYVLLGLDTHKNVAVAGIIVPALVWLLVLGVVRLARAPRVGLAVMAGVAVAAGLGTQLFDSRWPGPFTRPRAGYAQIGELYDALAGHCREMGWTEPHVAATCLETDYFQPVVIPAYVYERQHVLITPRTERMGGYLWPITEADACDEMRRSDFVILVDPAQAPSAYPYDQSIRAMFPRLRAFCEGNLTPLRRFRIWHFNVVLYTRPTPEVRP